MKIENQWSDGDICGVGVVFVGTDGRVIVQQRDEHARNAPNMIALFGGGKEDNESPQECLEREMKEEININFDPKKHELTVLCDTINAAVAKDDKVRIYIVSGINPEEIVIGEGAGFVQLSETECSSAKITSFTKEMLAKYWEDAKYSLSP
jgi:8-oxo-dGTP pyrophosphatase MutT (NUDIX family)